VSANVFDDPHLRKAVAASHEAMKVNPGYKPPGRRRVGGELLNQLHASLSSEVSAVLSKAARTTGATLVTDGLKNHKRPFINVVAIVPGLPPVVLGVIDCSSRVEENGSKEAT